jgi:hypothetical protein
MITPTARPEDAKAEPASFGHQQPRRNPKCNRPLKEATADGLDDPLGRPLFHSGKSPGTSSVIPERPKSNCTLADFETRSSLLGASSPLGTTATLDRVRVESVIGPLIADIHARRTMRVAGLVSGRSPLMERGECASPKLPKPTARRANRLSFLDLASLAAAFEPPKSRARKIRFRVAVQADLGGPVLRAKIIRFPWNLDW